MGGGRGSGWRGGNSERCLKWGGGGGKVIKECLPKILNIGCWVKGEVVFRGKGVLEESPPLSLKR